MSCFACERIRSCLVKRVQNWTGTRCGRCGRCSGASACRDAREAPTRCSTRSRRRRRWAAAGAAGAAAAAEALGRERGAGGAAAAKGELERLVLAEELREAEVERHDAVVVGVGADLTDALDEVVQRVLDDLAPDDLAEHVARLAGDRAHVEVDDVAVVHLRLRPAVVQPKRVGEALGEHEHRVEELHPADAVLAVAKLAHAEDADAHLGLKLLGAIAEEGLPDVGEEPEVTRRLVGLLDDQLQQLRASARERDEDRCERQHGGKGAVAAQVTAAERRQQQQQQQQQQAQHRLMGMAWPMDMLCVCV